MLHTIAWLTLALPLAPQGPGSGGMRAERAPRGRPSAPNILLVVADDLGTDLLECYEPFYPGTPTEPAPTPTPSIDWLAEGGLLFTDCWTSTSCTPSRAQILSGLHSQRTGLGGIGGATAPEPGLQLDTRMLPQFLRKNTPRYTNAAVGKWHLAATNDRADWNHALGPQSDPWFDLWAGSLFNLGAGGGQDYNRWEKTFATPLDPIMDEYAAPRRFPGRVVLTSATSNAPSPGHFATVDTIDDAVHLVGTLPEPWFLYVAFNAPHIPPTDPPAPLSVSSCRGFTTDPTCALTGTGRAQRIRCMTQWLDNEFGRLLCDLDAERLTERTVVMFMGDNGTVGDRGTAGGVLVPGAIVPPFDKEHGKGSMYQGGVNVPLLVRGPGVVKGVSHELVSSTDLLATIMDLAGAPAPNTLARDSVSFAPVLHGSKEGARKTVFVERFNPNFVPVDQGPPPGYEPTRHVRAIRNDLYKLIRVELRDDDGALVVDELLFDLSRPVPGGPQVDPYEAFDLRDQVTPGGSSALDRNYRALLAEMEREYPSLYR